MADSKYSGVCQQSCLPRPREILSTLLQDLIELTARTEQATEEFEVITGQISNKPPRADEVERLNNASLKLSTWQLSGSFQNISSTARAIIHSESFAGSIRPAVCSSDGDFR